MFLSKVDVGLSNADNTSDVTISTATQTALNGKLDTTHASEITAHAETTTRTITVGAGKQFTTIQAAINSIKKFLANGITITIQVDAGTYAEDIELAGFVGNGTIILSGGTNITLAESYIKIK